MSASATSPHTVLYEWHIAQGATFTDFSGWDMPLKYGSELAEHRAVRETAGLFDLSHMGEIRVSGPAGGRFLNTALVGNLAVVAVGRAKYSLLCNADGGIVDDLIVYRLAESDYLVVPNAGNTSSVLNALQERAAGFDVSVRNETLQTSLIAVQGPTAEAILLKLVPDAQHEQVTGLRYYSVTTVEVADIPVLLARTGYTGEDGFELFVINAHAVPLWEALQQAGQPHGLSPCGLASRDSLRLEAGMPLYGHELTLDVNPFAAGLGSVVSFKKDEDYIGRSALEALGAVDAPRRLVGLKSLGRRAARKNYRVLHGGRIVGEITSGLPSPTLGHPIALAYVDSDLTNPGTTLEVDLRGRSEPFEVVPLPFYQREH